MKHINAGFGNGERQTRVKECEKHLEGEKKLEVTDGKAMRTSVLQTQGIKFCQQRELEKGMATHSSILA